MASGDGNGQGDGSAAAAPAAGPKPASAERAGAAAWVAVGVVLAGLVATAFLWRALNQQREQDLRATLAAQADAVINPISGRLESLDLALVRISNRWERRPPDEAEWVNDATVLASHYVGFRAIAWVEPDYRVRWAAPLPAALALVGRDVGPEARGGADVNGVTIVTGLKRAGDALEFYALAPMRRDGAAGGAVIGYTLGAFDPRELLGGTLRSAQRDRFAFVVEEGGKALYAHGKPDARAAAPAVRAFAHGDLNWTVKVWPTGVLMRDRRMYLPEGVFGGGCLMSVMLGLSVHLARTARLRTREAEAAARVLEEEMAQRRAAEEELRTLTVQLCTSNRELQDFATVASHDLQEPLRKIQTFGDRLRVKCMDALSVEGRDYLARMQGAAGRMSSLINDLLTFSRVTTKAQPPAPVDLSALVRDVVGDLEARIEHECGRVEVGELPTVEADAMQMRQLFQNLIANGLKFHAAGRPPEVRVSAGPAEALADGREAVQVSVADNGIGFDEKYLDRIFAVFQRLHGRGEYEGTGIGLAVCRKIVERHGGAITARSTVGEGSTFLITLPLGQTTVAVTAVAATSGGPAR